MLKTKMLVPIVQVLEDDPNPEPERDTSNDIDLQAYVRAGEILEGWILKDCATITKWAHTHDFGVTTMHDLCKGKYNIPNGPTTDLVWRIALALSDNDPRMAQRLSYEYLAIVGVVPTAREISVVAELAAAEKQLRRIADKVAVWR